MKNPKKITQIINVHIETDLKREFFSLCASKGTSMTQAIKQFMFKEVQKNKKHTQNVSPNSTEIQQSIEKCIH